MTTENFTRQELIEMLSEAVIDAGDKFKKPGHWTDKIHDILHKHNVKEDLAFKKHIDSKMPDEIEYHKQKSKALRAVGDKPKDVDEASVREDLEGYTHRNHKLSLHKTTHDEGTDIVHDEETGEKHELSNVHPIHQNSKHVYAIQDDDHQSLYHVSHDGKKYHLSRSGEHLKSGHAWLPADSQHGEKFWQAGEKPVSFNTKEELHEHIQKIANKSNRGGNKARKDEDDRDQAYKERVKKYNSIDSVEEKAKFHLKHSGWGHAYDVVPGSVRVEKHPQRGHIITWTCKNKKTGKTDEGEREKPWGLSPANSAPIVKR